MTVRVRVGFSQMWNLWQVRVDDDRGARIVLETPDEREAERYAADIRSAAPTKLEDVPSRKGLIETPRPRRLTDGDVTC